MMTARPRLDRIEHRQPCFLLTAAAAFEAGGEAVEAAAPVHHIDLDGAQRARGMAVGALSFVHLRFPPSGCTRSG